MNYKEEGSGPTVVLCHGLFGDLDSLSNLSRELVSQGYHTVRFDMRNHGASAHYDDMSFATMADDLESLRIELSLDRIALVGHSLGGKLAMTYTQRFPENVWALVVADIAPVKYPDRHSQVLNLMASLPLSSLNSRAEAERQLATTNLDFATIKFLVKNLKHDPNGGFYWRVNLKGIIANYQTLMDAIPDAQSWPGPVLFIKGERSDYLLPEYEPATVKRFPNAQPKLLSGAGHWLHVEKPQMFNRQVTNFLKQFVQPSTQ